MPAEPTDAFLRPDPRQFPALPADRAAMWARFGTWDRPTFPSFMGLAVEEIRVGYCRMRLPYRPELDQPEGVVHGGALATLIDTVVVPAIGAAHDAMPGLLTLSMEVRFLGAVRGQDAVAEGWVTRRGRRVAFCEAAVCADDGTPVARGSLVYSVRPRDPA